MTIEQRIVAKLKELHVTQVELAAKTDLSKTAINNYCKGKQEPNTQALYKLSVALGVSMEWLLTGEDRNVIIPPSPWQLTEEQAHTASIYFPDLTEEQVALLNNFEKLPARDKKEIRMLIEVKLESLGGAEFSSSANGEKASGIA